MSEQDEPRIRRLYTPGGSVGLFFGPEEDESLADQVANMPKEMQEKILSGAGVDMEALEWDSDFWLRPSQLALVNSEHWMTVALAGRGWGKSHVLSTAIHKYAMKYPGRRLLLLGRTTSDVRDVMIYGASGIMSIINPKERPTYNPATRKLKWENGTYALCYSAERPDSLRGIQAHASFCDEVAAYRNNPGAGLANAFDQVKLLTRLPFVNPDGTPFRNQIFVATTPKRVPMILDIVQQAEEEPDKVLIVRGPTRANRALSDEYKETVEGMYAGTSIGKQELEGEILTDVDGALLHQHIIDDNRFDAEGAAEDWWKQLPHRVIGVDPSVSSKPSDECGIVAVGATGERKMYKRTAFVLEDASMLASPDKWAKRVVQLARKYAAVVVAEKNQGGEMVRMVIQAEDPFVPVVLVHAAVKKEQRAEPVGTAYERGAVRHVGFLPELEAQLTSWAPDMGMASPDRMDAVVHAITSLLVLPPKGMIGRATVAGSGVGRRMDIQDHNPANRYPEDHWYRGSVHSDDLEPNGKQDVLSRHGRSRRLRLGDAGNPYTLGYGAYTAPNKWR